MQLRNIRMNLSRQGTAARISQDSSVSRVVANHHAEMDALLDLIFNIGEIANFGPLKGAVSIVRSLLTTAKVRVFQLSICSLCMTSIQSVRDHAESIRQLLVSIITHLKTISDVITQDPDIARQLCQHTNHQLVVHLEELQQ
jgi:hypothetical protein